MSLSLETSLATWIRLYDFNFTVKSMRSSGYCACVSVYYFCVHVYMAYVISLGYARAWQNIKHLSSKIRCDIAAKFSVIVQTAGECRLIFWHVISKCFSLRKIISFLQRYRKTSNFRKSIVRNNNISKKWSNGIKTFGPMTRAGMNFDRLACWRNYPSALIKWSNETVRIVSSWRHVKYFGKLKWDWVHSMLIHLSGSTALMKSLIWAHKYHQCNVR